MKNKFLKILALVLGLVMLLGVFAGCKKTGENGDTATEADSTEAQESAESKEELYVIRPLMASASIRDLALGLTKALGELDGFDVKLKTDDNEYEAAEGRTYILLGSTEYPLSKQVSEGTRANGIVVNEEGDCTAIWASNEQLLWIAVQSFLGNCISDGQLKSREINGGAPIAADECVREGWSFNFPAYSGGTLNKFDDETAFSCGWGLNDVTGDEVLLSAVGNTSESEYNAYKEKLEDWGYRKDFERSIDSNRYALFYDSMGTGIYVYYIESAKKVRIVKDTVSTPLSEFNYTVPDSDNTEFYMMNISRHWQQVNEPSGTSEDTFLIRTADNSWIFMDGGMTNFNDGYTDDGFCEELYGFMREKSGIADGEKLKISAWYLSHAHNDHQVAFGRFIEKYHSQITVERVIANVPNDKIISGKVYKSYTAVLASIEKYFPEVMFLKAHTGMEIKLADVTLDILYTPDDNLENWVAGIKNLTPERHNDNFNLTSLISKIHIGNMSILQLGDNFRADALMAPMYSSDTLSCDVLKTAHHYYDGECNELYKSLIGKDKCRYVLVTHLLGGDSADTGEVKSLVEGLKDSQNQKIGYFIHSSYTEIYGFSFKNGSVVFNTYSV